MGRTLWPNGSGVGAVGGRGYPWGSLSGDLGPQPGGSSNLAENLFAQKLFFVQGGAVERKGAARRRRVHWRHTLILLLSPLSLFLSFHLSICSLRISVLFASLFSSHLCSLRISVLFASLFSSNLCSLRTSVLFCIPVLFASLF